MKYNVMLHKYSEKLHYIVKWIYSLHYGMIGTCTDILLCLNTYRHTYGKTLHYVIIYLLFWVGFNMCPFQLQRSFKRHEENKRKIGQERSSMQQADYQPMSSAHSMNARKCVHAQKPYPSQAFAHESSKVGGRGKREEERQERQRPGGWWKEKQPNKKTSEELKQGLPGQRSG